MKDLPGGGNTRIPRVLPATTDEAVRAILQVALKRDGLEVVAVAGVMGALSRIAAEHFDLLLSDLHMPYAGDGFTIVSAMRHAHPQAVTVVLSDYPVPEEALSLIRLLANEIHVRPIQITSLRKLVCEKITHSAASGLPPPESVATILEHDRDVTIQHWMELVEHDEELTCIPLSLEDRTGHLPNLIADLVNRLRLPPVVKANISPAARKHGDLRRRQGYTAAMVVEESRILEVSIFSTLQNNLRRVDFSKVLLDVVTIADEVDSQLKQAMFSYVEPRPGPAWSAA
jgi:CheY-like chemotaxis protein